MTKVVNYREDEEIYDFLRSHIEELGFENLSEYQRTLNRAVRTSNDSDYIAADTFLDKFENLFALDEMMPVEDIEFILECKETGDIEYASEVIEVYREFDRQKQAETLEKILLS